MKPLNLRSTSTVMTYLGIAVLSHITHAVSLEEFMTQVKDKNPAYQAAQLKKEAAILNQESGDLELSPYLSLGMRYFDDKKPTVVQVSPTPIMSTRSEGNTFTLGVAKKFITGTTLAVAYNQTKAAATVSGTVNTNYMDGATVTVSQSLWKNFLGYQSRLLRGREEIVKDLESTSAQASEIQTLITAEAAFWNAVYLKNALKTREDSLARAKKLVEWNRSNLRSGLVQQTDVLQTEALLIKNELDLSSANDEFIVGQKTLKDVLQLEYSSPDIDVTGDIAQTRPETISRLSPDTHVRIEARLAEFDSSLQQKIALETKEGLKPDLTLDAAYGGNGFGADAGQVRSDAFSTKQDTKAIGLSLKMDLDFSAKNHVARAAKLKADAATLIAKNQAVSSANDIVNVKRQYDVLSKNIVTLRKLVDISREKVQKEGTRLKNGRSTTLSVVTFENDLASAELTLNQLMSTQRKLEASAISYLEAKKN